MENVITKIEVQKKNKDRVNIFIDEEFAFPCSAELVYYHRLEKGKKIDSHLLKEVIEEDNYIKGKNDALKIIERSYKSEKEIYDKLIKKGYEEKTIGRVMAFLKEYKFIDDERYTEMFIKDKLFSSGKNKIKYALLKKGIDEDILNNKLALIKEEDERKFALDLARKKYAILIKSGSPFGKIYKKVGDYLISRGYDFNIVNSILDEVVKRDDIEGKTSSYEEEVMEETVLDRLREIADKRYNVLSKSEKDYEKLYRKLGQYLARRGYKWEDIKKTLKEIVKYG